MRRRLVLYRCPGGAPFARKELRYERPLAPWFELEDRRLGYREGLRPSPGGAEVFVEKAWLERRRRAAIAVDDELVADAGFDEFVRRRWEALDRGERLRLRFLVPSRLAAAEFTVRRVGSEPLPDGEPASRLRLELSGLLGWLAPPIEVLYRDRDRWLLRYEGFTNIRDLRGRNLAARIEFDAAPRPSAASRIAAARREPLERDCGS
ncbi:MAG: hypothetical protein RML12_01280 [Xanthomonadales bacterium]|nr:hypothetical protein [Xanthomonadales bacterium]